MSMLKYFHDGGGEDHGGHLHWPGTAEGYPVRTTSGAMPNLKEHEYENLGVALDYQWKIFKMWDERDAQMWRLVQDRINNGWYQLRGRDDRWIEQHQSYQIFLEWVQVYGELPVGKAPQQGGQYDGAAAGFDHSVELSAGVPQGGAFENQKGQYRQVGAAPAPPAGA